MAKQAKLRPITAALGVGFAVSLSGITPAQADENPFSLVDHQRGLMVAGHHEGEGSCGEGKCGEGEAMAEGEGKCGEGKCGEGEAKGDAMAAGEGNCGEGKCGEGEAMKDTMESEAMSEGEGN